MNDIAIRVDELSKLYQIGAIQNRHDTLRDQVAHSLKSLFRRNGRQSDSGVLCPVSGDNTIWALKDVSFTVPRGEVIGIIGHNGAGKSTLLKILSRITEPTKGFVEIRGRVGSLLEVGTGFHGELTGRENIYLNGAILGMRKAEIERKFDEMVAFAEVEKFIDTPVKHYSSGMYLRLAFAVAAHLEPEILIVDEVLAVGDASFQKKCLGKMQDVGKQGRTVLFVSHNMPAVTHLCSRAILLDQGRVVKDATPHEVVSTYLNSGHSTMAAREWPKTEKAPAGEVARLRAVRVRAEDGRVSETVDIRQPVGIDMEYEVLKSGYTILPYYDLYNEEGVLALEAVDLDPTWRRRSRPTGLYTSTAWIPGNLLAEGTLFVTAGITTMEPVIEQFHERDAVAFQVIDSLNGDSARGDWTGALGGAVIRPILKWSTQFNPNEKQQSVRKHHD